MKMDSSDGDTHTPNEAKSFSGAPSAPKEDDGRILEDSDSDSDSDSSDSEFVCSVCRKKFSGFVPYKQHEKSGKHAKAILKEKRAKKLLEKITAAENITGNDDEFLSFIKKPYAVCKTCSKQFEGPESYQMHLVSKAHRQKIIQASILDQVRDNGEINVDMLKELYKKKQPGGGDKEDLSEETMENIESLKSKDGESSDEPEELECKDCEKSFSGIIPYSQHIMSKVHEKAVKKKNLLGKIAKKDVNYSSDAGLRDISSLAVEDDILVCKLCTMTFSGPESAMMHLKSRGHSKNIDKFARKQKRKQQTASADTKSRSDSSSDSSDLETAATEKVEKVQDNQKPSSETKPKKVSESSSHRNNSSEAKVYLSSVSSKSENPSNQIKDSVSHDVRKVDLSEPSDAKADVENSDVKESEETSTKSQTFVGYEKYKMYKTFMNSLKDSTEDT